MTEMTIGTRRLQRVRGAYILNIPIYAVRTLGLQFGDELSVVLMDNGTLMIRKEKGIPATGAEFGDNTPARATQHTPEGVVADA